MKLVCFLMGDRNKVESDGRRGGEELRGAEGGKPIIRIYYVGKKDLFSIKKEYRGLLGYSYAV